jgi:hypothetical protein
MDGPGSCSRRGIGRSVPSGSNHSRHQRTELEDCRLIPENTFQIYFGAMMDDYLEVFLAFKGQGRAPVVSQIGITCTQQLRTMRDIDGLD